jgi:predicted RNase H-like nuclease (RuvC/YqgF family)
MEQQEEIINNQDKELDKLSMSVNVLKELGKMIGNELNIQNELINNLSNNVDTTTEKIKIETKRAKKIQKEDSGCLLM